MEYSILADSKVINARAPRRTAVFSAPIVFAHLLGVLFLFFGQTDVWAIRIVSLLPSNTEILDALGAGSDIVGVTRFDAVNPRRTVVGDFFQPNVEMIVALHPDLIVSGAFSSSRVTQHLRRLGMPTMEVPNPHSLAEMYETIEALARAVHREREAERVIHDLRRRLEAVRRRSARLPHPLKTYIEIDPPFWTVGGRDFLTEAMAAAGAENIFADLSRPSAQVSPEVILERNPELIVSFDAPRSALAQRPGWNKIAAIKNGWVLDDLDRDRLSRPSPRLLDGIEDLERRIERLLKP